MLKNILRIAIIGLNVLTWLVLTPTPLEGVEYGFWGALAGLGSLVGAGLLGRSGGGGVDKKTQAMLRDFLKRHLPQVTQWLASQRQMEAELTPQLRSFWGSMMPGPGGFRDLSPAVAGMRDAELQALMSGVEGAKTAATGMMNRQYGFRAPAGARAALEGRFGRELGMGKLDVLRQALGRNVELGTLGAQGLSGLLNPPSGFMSGVSGFAGLGAQAMPGTPWLTANVDIASLLRGLFGKK